MEAISKERRSGGGMISGRGMRSGGGMISGERR